MNSLDTRIGDLALAESRVGLPLESMGTGCKDNAGPEHESR